MGNAMPICYRKRFTALKGGRYTVKNTASDHKILRCWMVHDDRGSALLGFQEETRRQPYANILFRLEERKQLRLIL